MRQIGGDFVAEYVRFVSAASESPRDYHYWSACAIIGATLKRHVWVDRLTFKLYPNLYVVLVGRAGLGKGGAIRPALSVLKEAKTTNVISDRTTIEFVLERLSKGFPLIAANQGGTVTIGKDASILLSAPELSVFTSASQHTLPVLAELWDSPEGVYEYSTRSKGAWPIRDPNVSLLGGSTQEWLIASLPHNAVLGGFTRRVNFVFGKDRSQVIFWPSITNHMSTKAKLVNDLKHIATLRGAFSFAADARPVFEKVYTDSLPADFDDEAVSAFKTSKWVHCTKLAMCLSVARRDTLVIEKQDLEEAVAEVEKVTATIGNVFRAVGESDLVSASDRVLRLIELKGYATYKEILRANWRHVSGNDLQTILVTFVQAGILQENQMGSVIKYSLTAKVAP